MEFTETEIKMFEEAKKFLPPWKPQEGDWFSCINPVSGKGDVYVYHDLYMGAERNEDCFPLYSQEQLQGMLPHTISNMQPLPLIKKFERFIKDEFNRSKYLLRHAIEVEGWSMRQLWLAYVMHEKYQKVWDGETWVKEA